MTIGVLKHLIVLADLPDDAPVLLTGSDHSYYTPLHIETEATKFGSNYAEYTGDEHLAEGEKKILALVIR